MTANGKKDVVAEGGLRFKSKALGSPFGKQDPDASMSCFLCGRRWPRSSMKTRRLLGRNHLVCGEGCPK